jgi:hypothetical protein
MDNKELQKAQNIIDALFYDDKALTQWQHTLLENIISIAQTKLRQPDVSGRSEQLLALAQYMCEHQNNLDGKTAKDYLKDFLSQ